MNFIDTLNIFKCRNRYGICKMSAWMGVLRQDSVNCNVKCQKPENDINEVAQVKLVKDRTEKW